MNFFTRSLTLSHLFRQALEDRRLGLAKLVLFLFLAAPLSGQSDSCSGKFEWSIIIDEKEQGKVLLGPGDTWTGPAGVFVDNQNQNQGNANPQGGGSVVFLGPPIPLPELSSCAAGACGFEAEPINNGEYLKIVPIESDKGQNETDDEDDKPKSWGGGGSAGCSSCQGNMISGSFFENGVPSLAESKFSSYVVCGGRLMLLLDVNAASASDLGGANWLKLFRLSEGEIGTLDNLTAETTLNLPNGQIAIVSPAVGQVIIRVYDEAGLTDPMASLRLIQQGSSAVIEGFTGGVTDTRDLSFTYKPAPNFEGTSNLNGAFPFEGLEFTAIRGVKTSVSRHYSSYDEAIDETVDGAGNPIVRSKISTAWSRDEWISENRVSEKQEYFLLDYENSGQSHRSKLQVDYMVVGNDEVLVGERELYYKILHPYWHSDFIVTNTVNGVATDYPYRKGTSEFHESLVSETTNGRTTEYILDSVCDTEYPSTDEIAPNYFPAYDSRFLMRLGEIAPSGRGSAVSTLFELLPEVTLTSSSWKDSDGLDALDPGYGASIPVGASDEFLVSTSSRRKVEGNLIALGFNPEEREELAVVPDPWSTEAVSSKVIWEGNDDGTVNFYSYQYGTLDSNDQSFVVSQTQTVVDDSTHYQEIQEFNLANSAFDEAKVPIVGKTTRTLRLLELILDDEQKVSRTNEITSVTQWWDGGDWVDLPQYDSLETKDAQGLTTSTDSYGGVVQSVSIEVDDNTTQSIDRTGLMTTTSYNPATRTRVQTRAGVQGGMPTQVTTSVSTPGFLTLRAGLEDASDFGEGDGFPITTTHYTSQVGALITSSQTVSDWNGRTLWQSDSNGSLQSFLYEDKGLTTKTYRGNIYVDSAAVLLSTSTRYFDGRPKATFGPVVVDTTYDYEVDSETGLIRTTVVRGGLVSITEEDGSGRLIHQKSPAADGSGTVVLTQDYDDEHPTNGTGNLLAVSSNAPYTPTYRYSFDAMGEQLVGIDLNGNGQLDENSTDRFSKSLARYVSIGGVTWEEQTTTTFQDQSAGSAVSSIVTQRSRVTLPAANLSEYPRLISEVVTELPSGEVITEVRQVTSKGEVTTIRTSTAWQGSEVSKTRGGLLVFLQSPDSANPESWSYRYLANGVETTHIDARGNATISTTNAAGQVVQVRQPAIAQTTTYQYHPAGSNGEGQVSHIINNAGETTLYDYNIRGQVTAVSGDTYQLTYTYTEAGQLDTLTTYRSAESPAVTKWVYQASTGLLQQKLYDSDPAGQTGSGPSYTYYPGGQLHERIWLRTNGNGDPLTTTYSYSPLGDLTGVSYNDDVTPDVAYSNHDRLGRPKAVSQTLDSSVVHSAAMTYDPAEGFLASESFGPGFLANRTLSRQSSASSTPGGTNTLTLTAPGTTNPEFQRVYTRDLTNPYRPSQITADGHTVNYLEYLPGTGHATSYQITQGTGILHHTRNFDQGGRLTGSIARAGGPTGAILTSAGYKYDSAGRREWLTREDGTRWEYGYNSKGEVTSGNKRLPNGEELLAGQQFEYEYDGIGNRLLARFGGGELGYQAIGENGKSVKVKDREIVYTPNNLNQYDEISHPGVLQILGMSTSSTKESTAAKASDIEVTGQTGPNSFQGWPGRWRAEVSKTELGVTDGAPAFADITVTEDGEPVEGGGALWIPASVTEPSHDLDGNLTNDGHWSYSWNGESRLIAMETTPAAETAGHLWMRLKFAYDWQGRRVRKTVEAKPNGSTIEVQKDLRFLYDGWNLIAEYQLTTQNSSLTLQNSYLWGPDLSGSEQGAGGVGGLLSVTRHSTSPVANHQPAFDGNGNIIAWIDEAGAVVQRNDYDPFGDLISKQGQVEGVNFGFSTKYTDEETGLCYYGYRYYDSVTGRWVSRDPKREGGGVNIYVISGNSFSDSFDYLGLFKMSFHAFIHKDIGSKIDYRTDKFPDRKVSGFFFEEPGFGLTGSTLWYTETDNRDFAVVRGLAGSPAPRSKTLSSRLESISKEIKISDIGHMEGKEWFVTGGAPSVRIRRKLAKNNNSPPWLVVKEEKTAKYSQVSQAYDTSDKTSVITVKSSASYPFSSLAPAINFEVSFTLCRISDKIATVGVRGMHDRFPYYEALLHTSDGMQEFYRYNAKLAGHSGPSLGNLGVVNRERFGYVYKIIER